MESDFVVFFIIVLLYISLRIKYVRQDNKVRQIVSNTKWLKFIYAEKATKFCEIFL